jgi:hypothetical protein
VIQSEIGLPVPASFSGVYFNLLNGTNSSSDVGAPGWDINPYLGSNGFSIYWCPGCGGVAESASGSLLVLGPGDTVGPTSSYTTALAAAAFMTTQTAYFGIRFLNEETAAVNYGYMLLSTTGPNGFPATMVSYAYDDSGAAITIPPPSLDVFGDGFENTVTFAE